LIAKLPMALDEHASAYRRRQERDQALLDRYYQRSKREARFYSKVGPAAAPRLYFADFDDAHRRVALLLEDIDGRRGDALRGCTVDEAALVVDAIAPFHARWWGERPPARELAKATTDDPRVRQERYARHLPDFLATYGSAFPSPITEIAQALETRLAAVAETLSRRSRTLIHGDLQPDNLIFRRGAAVVLDWQTVAIGPPGRDVVPFLVGALSVADRQEAESALLDRYMSRLGEHGVRSYSVDELRAEGRLALLVLFAGMVVWLTGLDPDDVTARERALQDAVVNDGRMTAALLDNNVEDLLSGLPTT
jgi:tRNA A-37 threonylcarbamoyl transferase component Bud32